MPHASARPIRLSMPVFGFTFQAASSGAAAETQQREIKKRADRMLQEEAAREANLDIKKKQLEASMLEAQKAAAVLFFFQGRKDHPA